MKHPLFNRGKLSALVALAIICGGSITYMSVKAPPSHYCQAQQRYLTDEEFLNASIALLYSDMNHEVTYPDGKKVKMKDVSNVYKGIDFDPSNPNCCSVGWGYEPSIFTRYFGNEEIEVRLNPRTSKGPVSQMGDSFYFFNYTVCGELSSSYMFMGGGGGITTSNYLETISRK